MTFKEMFQYAVFILCIFVIVTMFAFIGFHLDAKYGNKECDTTIIIHEHTPVRDSIVYDTVYFRCLTVPDDTIYSILETHKEDRYAIPTKLTHK